MKHALVSALLGFLTLGTGMAEAIELHSTIFPEGRTVDIRLEPLPGAARGRVNAQVTFRDGQSRIMVEYDDLKPAILFAGDVTCYVLWAVSRDGQAENLGEFLVDNPKNKLEFTTGKKAFALMVTAEPYYLVSRPSSLVTYIARPSTDRRATSAAFEFVGLGPSPNPALTSITDIRWDSKTPLTLLQARKAHELASQNDAPVHANQIYREALEALDEANALEEKQQRNRKLLDAARRSVALSNEALNITARRKEGIEIEKQIAARRAEMQALEQRAAESEAAAQKALDAARAAEISAEEAEQRLEASRTDMEQLYEQKQLLEKQAEALRAETLGLEAGMVSLRKEKSDLSQRLSSALSHVAETRNSARGYVVNLPDILFDVNQATLKTETKPVLAKLAGILLVIPDLKVTVEGHTDATGSEEYNLDLSRRRAESVLEFLSGEGVERGRLSATGFGKSKPVADNDTAEGRKKNRRVEIVIAGG